MGSTVCDLGVAARAIVDDKILLVKEARGPYVGKWSLPKGHVNVGEDTETAVLRELYEETGHLGVAIAEDDSIIKGGVVVLVEIDVEPDEWNWMSEDEKIVEVGWCIEVPDELFWGSEEIERLVK